MVVWERREGVNNLCWLRSCRAGCWWLDGGEWLLEWAGWELELVVESEECGWINEDGVVIEWG